MKNREMEQAKEELQDQIKQARLSELDELIAEKGLSFEDVREILDKE